MVAPGGKNLWVAASDGDIDRVKALIEAGATPNDKDENSYTPMHAAASYAHLELLDYLLSQGGNVNITDDDNDTPLFTCETVEAAQWLVEHGADATHKNEEGLTAAETAAAEERPNVAAYLHSVTGTAPPVAPTSEGEGVSELAVDQFASRQTADLMAQAQAVMEEASRTGADPDAALRDLVQRAVREGFDFGGDLNAVVGATGGAGSAPAEGGADEEAHKRARGD